MSHRKSNHRSEVNKWVQSEQEDEDVDVLHEAFYIKVPYWI